MYIQVHDCTYKMGVVSVVGVSSEGGEVTREEEEYCRLAIQYYTRGQEVLKRAKTDRSIWYSIEADLAAIHYTEGQQLQERPPLSRRGLNEVRGGVGGLYCMDTVLGTYCA